MTDWSEQKIRQICQTYSTPYYLYDQQQLAENYTKLRAQLHPSSDIYLSLKANNNLYLANQFQQMGSGVEVASSGELNLALHAGFPPERIIMSGPGKTIHDLSAAIHSGIKSINVESLDELILTSQIANSIGKTVPFSVRINPDLKEKVSNINMGGAPRQFGVDESQLDLFFQSARALPNMRFLGIHVYLGTQNLLKETILKSFEYTISLAERIEATYGFRSQLINLGGGFGVPYFPHEQTLDINGVMEAANVLINDYVQTKPTSRFIIESGRFLLADYGIYVATILYRKVSKGEIFLITDGGMHHHAAATFRGRSMRNNYPLKVITKDNRPNRLQTLERVNITGVLCTPEDCLAKSVEIPRAEPGDKIVWLKSGAYGLAYSPQQFLGHATPMELLLSADNVVVIRQRGTEKDLLLNQVMDFQ